MKVIFFVVPILALGIVTSAHATADLTVNYGSLSAPFNAAGLFQIVEAGNRFNDTPRTVLYDEGGDSPGSGSASPLTSDNYEIDLDFTALTRTDFDGGEYLNILDPTAAVSLYRGSTRLASGTADNGSLSIENLTIAPGDYSLRFTGEVYNPFDTTNLEAEGTVGFSGSPSPVPEPATWALMLIGFGGLGAVLRGRRHTGGVTA